LKFVFWIFVNGRHRLGLPLELTTLKPEWCTVWAFGAKSWRLTPHLYRTRKAPNLEFSHITIILVIGRFVI